MVLVQKWPFFQLFLFRQYRPENVFYDILERKNVFLGYKNKKFKKWKNWHFSKRVNPWFWSKNGHCSNPFIFRQYRQEESLLRYSRMKKNDFLGYKNKKFKKSKNWHFYKVVNPWFWSKNGHFSNPFLLGNIDQKMSFTIFYNKKFLSRLWKQEIQKVEKSTFF